MSGSRVLVIGGQGVLGTLVARALREDGHDVLRAGRRPEPGAPADLRHVELDDAATLAAALAEVDLAVSTVLHPALTPERVVLREGGTLISVASLSLADRLTLKSEQSGARGAVLVHAGLNPGLMTVLLAELLDAHPESEWVTVAATVSGLQNMGGLAFDSVWPFLTAQPRHPVARVPFPEPVGVRRCVELGSGEDGWLGELAAGREGHTWITLDQPPVSALLLAVNRVGLMQHLPAPLFKSVQGRARAKPSSEPKRDWVAVGRGDRVTASSSIVGVGDYRVSVHAIRAFCAALIARRERGTLPLGVSGAEQLMRPDELVDSLAAHGVELIRDSGAHASADAVTADG